jgi:hypothetical protein
MKDDPTVIPRWTVGESLLELRDNVLSGLSRWSRVIISLRAHGYTSTKISIACRITESTVLDLEHKPSQIPSHDVGEALIALYRRNVERLK